jgi:sporulation integral membrane protein YtvI
MMEMFGNIYEEISTALAVGISWINSFEYSDIFLEHAKTFTGEISSMAITKLSVMAASLPGIGVGVFVTVIATIFFEMELPRMVSFARLMLPEEACCRIESVAGETLPTLKGCVRAYIILFAMTYVELAAGLIILGIPGAMIISLIIALLDILPVLGTGTVLIPWSIIAFSTGRAATGAGVLILYVIISVVRNIAEPHLVGRQIGLSPAIMLPCMLVGLKIIGIAGLFIFPLAVAAALRFAVKTRTRG